MVKIHNIVWIDTTTIITGFTRFESFNEISLCLPKVLIMSFGIFKKVFSVSLVRLLTYCLLTTFAVFVSSLSRKVSEVKFRFVLIMFTD